MASELRISADWISTTITSRVTAYGHLHTSDPRRVAAARLAVHAYHATEALRDIANCLTTLDTLDEEWAPETHACSDCCLGGATQRAETGTHLCDRCFDQHMQVANARREQP